MSITAGINKAISNPEKNCLAIKKINPTEKIATGNRDR